MRQIKYELKEYICPWDNHKFERRVAKGTQVKCPKCHNFILTWKKIEKK